MPSSTPRSRRLLKVGGLLLVAALLIPAAAAARTLHWSSMEVSARLDADGRLHVIERQTMVFDGDWNGGERGFNLRSGQKIDFKRLSRIDTETGRTIDLAEGDLDLVDRYGWGDGHNLQWRSRLPSDPPFTQRTLVYELEYTLSGVLRQEGDIYLLDHDFAFPDRPGAIEQFTLDLEFDPIWQPPRNWPSHLERHDLPRGSSVVVVADLTYLGADHPAGVIRSLPRWLLLGIPILTLLVMGGLFARFVIDERTHGRFSPPDAPHDLDEAWLEANLLDLRPEEVGALWDRKVGAPEVAALIARLVAEGKLSSTVEERRKWFTRSQVLTLELQVDRSRFNGYVRRLIDKLFFDNKTMVDTAAIRKHYRKSGFSPSRVIAGDIERRLRQLPNLGSPRPSPSWKTTARLSVAFVVLAALEALTRGADGATLILALTLGAAFPALLGWGMASVYRKRIHRLPIGLIGILIPGLLVWTIGFGTNELTGFAGLLALALLPLLLFNSFLNQARCRESAEALRRRQRLNVARDWLRRQLESPTPRLRDEWFPYLLALGLNRQVDRWFGNFGGTATQRGASQLSSYGAGGTGTGSSWTGGGGQFGGAGATAAWAAAATSLGAGVTKPSSGGGSGSSGGGSSGGGSGGGW